MKVPPATVNPVEFQWFDRFGNVLNLRARQRNLTGITSHKTDVGPFLNDVDDVTGHWRPLTFGARWPMQNRASRKVAATMDQAEATKQLLSLSLPEMNYRRRGPLFQGRFKALLHDLEDSALIINRYIHLNPVRTKRLGGHEARAGAAQRFGPVAEQVDKELVRARVAVLNSYCWSS